MLLVLNLPLVGPVGQAAEDPPAALRRHPDLATVGVYGMRQSAFDLFLLYAIGLLGLLMRRFDFPTAPVVVGMIPGRWPRRRCATRCPSAKATGASSQRPVSVLLLVIVAMVLLLPRIARRGAARSADRQRAVGQPCRRRIAICASAPIHGWLSFRQDVAELAATGREEGGAHSWSISERLEAVGRGARAHHVDAGHAPRFASATSVGSV